MSSTYRLKNPDAEAQFQELLKQEKLTGKLFTLSERSKKLFVEAIGGYTRLAAQGFIGLLDLTTGEIELIPAWNKDDGKKRIPFVYEGVNYFVDSIEPLGSNSGDAHTQAVSKLKLGHKGGINGYIAGFGLFKGDGTENEKRNFIYEFRNRSSSQNMHAFEYDDLYLLANYKTLLDGEHNLFHQKRSIPAEISIKLLDALCEQLPLNEKTQLRGVTKNLAKNIAAEKKFRNLDDEDLNRKLRNNMLIAAKHGHIDVVERIYALSDRVPGLSLNCKDSENKTLLQLLAEKEPISIKTIAHFLKLGAIPDNVLLQILTNKMFTATMEGQFELVEEIYALKPQVSGLSLNCKNSKNKTLLQVIAKKEPLETVERLLNLGEKGDGNLRSVLAGKILTAARDGKLELIEKIYALQPRVDGLSLDCINLKNQTPLQLAAGNDHLETVIGLLALGAKPDEGLLEILANKMFTAATEGQFELVEKIYALKPQVTGLSLNCKNSKGKTLLQVIAEKEPLETVERLLNLGEEVDENLATSLSDRMFTAAAEGQFELIEKIYALKPRAKGLSLNCKNSKGKTLLQVIAEKEPLETVERLLNLGEKGDGNLRRALAGQILTAARDGKLELIEKIYALKPKVDDISLDCINSTNKTPLQLAAERDHLETVAGLLALGAKPNNVLLEILTDKMFTAAKKDQFELVEKIYVLTRQIKDLSLGCKNSENKTLLQILAGKGSIKAIETVERLLNWGEKGDENLRRALVIEILTAARDGKLELIEKIYALKPKVDGLSLDCINSKDQTPLQLAAGKGHLETVLGLIRLGAKPDTNLVRELTKKMILAACNSPDQNLFHSIYKLRIQIPELLVVCKYEEVLDEENLNNSSPAERFLDIEFALDFAKANSDHQLVSLLSSTKFKKEPPKNLSSENGDKNPKATQARLNINKFFEEKVQTEINQRKVLSQGFRNV